MPQQCMKPRNNERSARKCNIGSSKRHLREKLSSGRAFDDGAMRGVSGNQTRYSAPVAILKRRISLEKRCIQYINKTGERRS